MRQAIVSYAKRKLSSNQNLSMELYLRNIARRWKKEFSVEAERKLIFSPYVTSSTAESVVGQSGPCEIHTEFSVELFASHASSLETLRLLMDRGHKLFHVTNLHAKVFLIPRQFASVGSQNLTLGGTTNREASVVLQDVRHLEVLGKH
jgi:phosphatidylserine/phosphatidylglycerophosphate/cardiolipin synthase-like enzyme